MAQFLIRILFIALIFSSVDAAIDTVHMDNAHTEGSGHLVHDFDDFNSGIDDPEDNCNHPCHCAQQIGALFSNTLYSFNTDDIDKISYYYQYQYQPLSPLFRPPII